MRKILAGFTLCLLPLLCHADEYAVWQGKIYAVSYNPAGRPEGVSDADVIDALKHAAEVWRACGVQVQYKGLTQQAMDRLDGNNVIGWQKDIPGLLALTLPQYLRRIMLDADIRLNAGQIHDKQVLKQVVAHEVGHALGLFDHSREPDSLMNGEEFVTKGLDKPSASDMALCQARYQWK